MPTKSAKTEHTMSVQPVKMKRNTIKLEGEKRKNDLLHDLQTGLDTNMSQLAKHF